MALLRRTSTVFHRSILYPSILAIRGEFGMYRKLQELKALQWSNAEEVRRHQSHRLAELLGHAARTVPFYREDWDVEVPVLAEYASDVLRRLPLLTKEDLQQNIERLRSEESPVRVSEKTTGGSTGRPVTVIKDREALGRERAASWLGYGWFGVEIGDRGARFWGSPIDLGERRIRFALADLAMNRIRFSAFAFDDKDLGNYWDRCLKWMPDYLYGYVSMLTEFARHLRSQGYDGARLDLKVVITTAEALTAPQRELLEDIFDAPVQNEYGCGEVGAIAYECPQGCLHVMADNVVVELLKEDGSPASPGEVGEVVVTDLNNRAMPLVRYRIGDRAVKGEECDCGRGFPVLKEIQGRAYDFVQDCDGRRFHGEYFMYLFEDLRDRGAEIDQFRVVQLSEDELLVKVAAPKPLAEEDEAFIRQRIGRDVMGMLVKVRRVLEIERLDSGKTQVVHNQWLLDERST